MMGETVVLRQREQVGDQASDWTTAQLFDEPKAAPSESRQADPPSLIGELPARLRELCASSKGIPLERALQIQESALNETHREEEKKVLEAALARVAEDLGPAWENACAADKISHLGLARMLHDQGASPEAIERCLRGEIAAQEIQDSVTVRNRAVGIPDDAPFHQLVMEEKLKSYVAAFLSGWAERVQSAEKKPDLTYDEVKFVVDIGNIPFSQWRLRPLVCLGAAAALSVPVVGWGLGAMWAGGYFSDGPKLNGSLKCIFNKPDPFSTQSPALKHFFAEVRARGCEPVATVTGMELNFTFKLRV